MKIFTINGLIVALAFCAYPVVAQNADDDAPDQAFSLQGALDLFKKSKSPEHFEELLNKPDNTVNNLDLNNDGEVDYIRVIDNREDDLHVLVLQVPLNNRENEDVAVIEIEKTGPENAILQIKGKRKVFGREIIAEPAEEQASPDAFVIDGVDNGPFVAVPEYSFRRVVVNVWFWPGVRFIFSPAYRVWVSPYRWGVWPGWYRTWKPVPWYTIRPKRAHYYPSYTFVSVNRIPRAHHVYRAYRKNYYHDGGRPHYYGRGDGSRRPRRR